MDNDKAGYVRTTVRTDDLISITVDRAAALQAVRTQLAEFAKNAAQAAALFEQGKPREAYRAFPFHAPAGKNLEEFVNVFTTTG